MSTPGPTESSGTSARGLGATAARGALVMLTGQGVRVVLQFASLVALARLLTPHDYGLVAVVLVIIGVGEIFRDFGLSSAAIRAPELSRDESTNLFWINSGIGFVLGSALFFLAGVVAQAFGQPEVVGIARAMSIVFLLNGITTQFRALLVRGLRFRWLATMDVLAPAIALASALTAALLGWGYWSLVVQNITQALALLTGAVIGARVIPGLPRRDVSVRSFVSFGGNIVLTQLVMYATNRLDTAVIGYVNGATPLGLYNRAQQLVVTPVSQIQAPATSVAMPVLTRLNDHPERFDAFLLRGQLALGYPIALAMAFVAAAAEPIVRIMLGEQWLAAVPLLQLFAVMGIARNLAFVGSWVYVVRGLSTSLFRFTAATAIVPIAGILIGSHWGVVGVATGVALAPWITWPISIGWLSRVTSVPVRSLYGGALRIILVAAITCTTASVTIALLPPLPAIGSIAVCAGVGAATLALLCLHPALRADARDLREVALLVIRRRSRSSSAPAAEQRDGEPDQEPGASST